ncbi:MAG: nucleotide excision repair endonuclease [Acidobacteria bacterium]|nr:MAG: nucleotide excision repair endonuclease [Acidobacteriota bacterium]
MKGPALVDRIVASLADGPPRSTADLAREFLRVGVLDEATAESLLGGLLAADPRLERLGTVWRVRGSAARGLPLRAPFAAVVAPHGVPLAGFLARGPGKPAMTVCAGGEAEAARFEERTGRKLPRPVLSLAEVARRLRGHRGRADPVAIAESLGCPHVEPVEGAGGPAADRLAAVVADAWAALVEELALEGVGDTLALHRMLEAALEPADFEGKAFGPSDLRCLPELPGAYRFLAADGTTIYVGQSANLRARVCSYFAGSPRDEKDRLLRAESFRLETRTVDSVPDALLAEAEWIRRFEPRLNVKRRALGPAPPDGVLVAPAPWRGGAALFSIAGGRLVRRRLLLPGPRRARRAAAEAVDAVLSPPPAPPRADRAARLLRTWMRLREDRRLIEPGRDGGREEMIGRVLQLSGEP